MVKEQFRETNVASEVSHISFGVDSMHDMHMQASVEVFSKSLYNEDAKRTPALYGALDRRMGVSSTGVDCETCSKKLSDCVGHFGYQDLELPVFHVGYFRSIIQILQTICKRCAHVLLTHEERRFYSRRIQNPNLDSLMRKALRKQIWEKAKKKRACPNCKANNGPVKKAGFLKIVHEKYKNLKKTDPIIQEKLAELAPKMERDKEYKNMVEQNYRCVFDQYLYPNVV